MIKLDSIKKEWIVSATARRVYRATASMSIAFFVAYVVLAMTHSVPAVVSLLLKPLLLVWALSMATTAAGMELFLFYLDDSPALKQAFWFCVMLLPPIGPAIYCFRVYSRSKVLEKVLEKETAEYAVSDADLSR